ncbi:hypothetical protein EG329_011765 [Mollisiaceae sp. DMI_Dod_QoI]|nr:hypothetical protein EG329_011765 [Helotiales sp. DMI_Dod_QoI]
MSSLSTITGAFQYETLSKLQEEQPAMFYPRSEQKVDAVPEVSLKTRSTLQGLETELSSKITTTAATNETSQEFKKSPAQIYLELDEELDRRAGVLNARLGSDKNWETTSSPKDSAPTNSSTKHGTIDLFTKHNRIKDALLKQFHEFNLYLQDHPTPVQDPRVEDELSILVKLVANTDTNFAGVDELRNKIERDEKRYLIPTDSLVLYLRKYRVVLHDLGGTLGLDMDVLAASKRVLSAVRQLNQRKKSPEQIGQGKEAKEKRDERPKDKSIEDSGKSHVATKDSKLEALETQEICTEDVSQQKQRREIAITNSVSTVAKGNEENIEETDAKTTVTILHWPELNWSELELDGRLQEDKAEEHEQLESQQESEKRLDTLDGPPLEDVDEQLEMETLHESAIETALEVLNLFATQLSVDDEIDERIEWQMEKIVQLSEGESESDWEINNLQEDVREPLGDFIEDWVLNALKQYRIFLYSWAHVKPKLDQTLVDKIHELRNLIAREREATSAEDVDQMSTSSELSENRFLDAGEEHVMTEGSCSCGTVCELALARPLTPEGELDESERKLSSWYEKRQALNNQRAKLIVEYLDLHTEALQAGEPVDPVIRLYVKKLRDMSRGKEKENSVDEEEEEFFEAENWQTQAFRMDLANYYYECQDSHCNIELDNDVVEACNELLKVMSQQHLASAKSMIFGGMLL